MYTLALAAAHTRAPSEHGTLGSIGHCIGIGCIYSTKRNKYKAIAYVFTEYVPVQYTHRLEGARRKAGEVAASAAHTHTHTSEACVITPTPSKIPSFFLSRMFHAYTIEIEEMDFLDADPASTRCAHCTERSRRMWRTAHTRTTFCLFAPDAKRWFSFICN